MSTAISGPFAGSAPCSAFLSAVTTPGGTVPRANGASRTAPFSMTSAAPTGDKRRVLWRATRSRRSARCGSVRRSPPHRTTHAGGGPARTGRDPAPGSHHRQPSRLPDRTEQAARELRGDGTEPGLAGRSDLYTDRRRLALSRRADRHAYPQGGGLEHARDPACLDRPRGARHGHQASATSTRVRHRSRTHGDAMAHSSIPIAGSSTPPTSIAKSLPRRR